MLQPARVHESFQFGAEPLPHLDPIPATDDGDIDAF